MPGLYFKLCTKLHKKWSLVHTLRACIPIARSILRNSAANSVARTTFSYGQTSCWYTDRPNIQGSTPLSARRDLLSCCLTISFTFSREGREQSLKKKKWSPPQPSKREIWSSPRLQKEMVSPPPHAPKQESPAPSYSLWKKGASFYQRAPLLLGKSPSVSRRLKTPRP